MLWNKTHNGNKQVVEAMIAALELSRLKLQAVALAAFVTHNSNSGTMFDRPSAELE